MNKLQENVKQLVASKVLKNIHKISLAEDKKEKDEMRWAKVIAGTVLFVIFTLFILKFF